MIDLHHGDCTQVMRGLAENSVDAIVTDPPYGLSFMGKGWDHGVPDAATWTEALRVLKPGGYLLAFGGTRTYHRMACAIEDAGFEIRDQIGWAFGSGFPKSHNGPWGGTALKPSWEPICVARKPLIGTVEQNWREHGTGALNIDGCRVDGGERPLRESDRRDGANGTYGDGLGGSMAAGNTTIGRWPANLIHDGSDEVVAGFPVTTSGGGPKPGTPRTKANTYGEPTVSESAAYGSNTGNAARFFYCAKADRADRNDGCEHMERKPLNWSAGTQNPGSFQAEGTDRTSPNHHPTVKPTDLMRYLCRLVTPKGGLVLDPFMGSGSTGRGAVLEGFRFVGIELDAEYLAIARARIDAARRRGHQPDLLEAA